MKTILLALLLSQDKKKPDVFTDPEKAGADYKIQGEYAGDKMGAQVVALGGGAFDVVILEGGLPGAGWNLKGRSKAKAKTEGDKTLITGDWSGEIAGGKLAAKSATGQVELKRILRESPTMGAKPPEGAVVLFDGKSADEWKNGRIVEENLLFCGVDSKKKFRDVKLHIEFRPSFMPAARGQGRSNSGVYLGGRHEVQVLDSFGLEGKNNECGGIYSIAAPKVNMCLPPLQWQTYDIEYRAPRFDDAGKKTANAKITVRHNGVLIHEEQDIPNGTTAAPVKESNEPGPIHLQHHGDPVMYRNIWLVELK